MRSDRAASRAVTARARCPWPSGCSLNRASEKSAVSSFERLRADVGSEVSTRRTYSSGASSMRRGTPAWARPSSNGGVGSDDRSPVVVWHSGKRVEGLMASEASTASRGPFGGPRRVSTSTIRLGSWRPRRRPEHRASEVALPKACRCAAPPELAALGLGVGGRGGLRLRAWVADVLSSARSAMSTSTVAIMLSGPRCRGTRAGDRSRWADRADEAETPSGARRGRARTRPPGGAVDPPVSSWTWKGASSEASATRASRPTATTSRPRPRPVEDEGASTQP